VRRAGRRRKERRAGRRRKERRVGRRRKERRVGRRRRERRVGRRERRVGRLLERTQEGEWKEGKGGKEGVSMGRVVEGGLQAPLAASIHLLSAVRRAASRWR
jgi:hypothetical protein